MDVGRDERQILCVLKTREKHHYYFETALKPRNVAKLSRNCLSFYETIGIRGGGTRPWLGHLLFLTGGTLVNREI